MARETDGFRYALEAVLSFSGGRHMLNTSEVCAFTGFKSIKTVKKHFPMNGGFISATELARCMSATPKRGKR